MIERHYDTVLRRLLLGFPAVTILGPRQCGKTTFIRQVLPEWTYLDLERPSDASLPVAKLVQPRFRIRSKKFRGVPVSQTDSAVDNQ